MILPCSVPSVSRIIYQLGLYLLLASELRPKAEVLLLNLRQPGELTGDLFAPVQPERVTKAMAVMDAISAR